MPQIAAAAMNSSAKSRSETPSSEFAVGRSKPSAVAVIARSIGNDVPASAAEPSGHSLRRFRQSASRPRSRPEHLDIGQEMMAEGDGLRDLEMGIARHHRRGMPLGLADERRLQRLGLAVEPVDGAAQLEAEIGRDLVVARARRVEAPGVGPDDLGEPRLDIHVNVLAVAAELEAPGLDVAEDLL